MLRYDSIAIRVLIFESHVRTDMKKRTPEIKVPGKFDPQIRWLLVYFVATLLLLWIWQELFRQFAVQTIPYSEFKTYLSRHEVAEASITQDEIVGRIEPRTAPETKASPADAVPAAADNQAGVSRPRQAAGRQAPSSSAPCASRTRTLSTNFRLPVLNTAARAPALSRNSSWLGCCPSW
jgi:cytoskeletal protein RodZ